MTSHRIAWHSMVVTIFSFFFFHISFIDIFFGVFLSEFELFLSTIHLQYPVTFLCRARFKKIYQKKTEIIEEIQERKKKAHDIYLHARSDYMAFVDFLPMSTMCFTSIYRSKHDCRNWILNVFLYSSRFLSPFHLSSKFGDLLFGYGFHSHFVSRSHRQKFIIQHEKRKIHVYSIFNNSQYHFFLFLFWEVEGAEWSVDFVRVAINEFSLNYICNKWIKDHSSIL